MSYPQEVEMVVARLKDKYGDNIELKKDTYEALYKNAVFRCKKHNYEFLAHPNNLLSDRLYGCPLCGAEKARENKMVSLEEFKNRFYEIYGKYGYKLVDESFKGLKEKVNVICPKHGLFSITAERLVINSKARSTCRYCKDVNEEIRKPFLENAKTIDRSNWIGNTEDFIRKARSIHGDKYDYSQSVYKSAFEKVKVICKEHGEFWITPDNHIRGKKGCKICGMESSIKNRSLTIEKIKEKIKEIHGDTITVAEDAKYVNNITPIKLICPKHGIFYSSASSIVNRKAGCPNCKKSKGEEAIAKVLNYFNIKYIREFGIPNVDKNYRYDFCIPNNRILIEFHGQQHYKEIELFGGQKELERIINSDIEKEMLAKANGYILITFSPEDYKYGVLEEKLVRRLLGLLVITKEQFLEYMKKFGRFSNTSEKGEKKWVK